MAQAAPPNAGNPSADSHGAQADGGVDHDGITRTHSRNPSRSHSYARVTPSEMPLPSEDIQLPRPPFLGSALSQETIRPAPTPPIKIPDAAEDSQRRLDDDDAISPTCMDGYMRDRYPAANAPSYIDEYMRNRVPSVSFDNELRLDSGHRQSIEEPLARPLAKPVPKPARDRLRGRSLLQAMAEQSKTARAHSESGTAHYDPQTGLPYTPYSTSPPRDQARVGEGRFPLLQATVDAMARESNPDLSNAQSLTSASTVSPDTSSAITPSDDGLYLTTSRTVHSPYSAGQAFSYEEHPQPYRRASQRWRDGDMQASPQDFFSRASGSLRSKSFRSSRRVSSDITRSPRSPRSAASSFLRGFSISSSTDNGVTDGPPAVDAEGQTIGEDYVLGKRIGYGGFSTIKEVTQLSASGSQRKLAVKIVRRHIANKSEAENEAAQAEFEHEVELWRFLSHKHILPLEAVYKLDEATFCFIPLNVGGTLFDLVRTNRSGLDPEIAKSYSHQLASALRYLHLDARVVHRDVKLENCLIETPSGHPGLLRVCDFGMAEWISHDNSPDGNASDRPPQKQYGPADSSTSAFAGGSLEYAAPEILRIAKDGDGDIDDAGYAERSIVSPAVDMWAFGVCVYSLLIGSRPFQNSFQPRVVMAILGGNWDREKVSNKAGKDPLDLIEGCLEMDHQLRWDVLNVLECNWLEGVGSEEDSNVGPSGWRL